MGNKRCGTTYQTITPRKTQRATAEAIYDYLVAHPKDIPGSHSEYLTFRLGDRSAACVQVCDLNGLNLSAWPSTTTEIQVERGWAANWGDRIGLGVVFSNPHSLAPGEREESIRHIRRAIGRTLRHHAKEDARVAERIAARTARQTQESAVSTNIHLHVPADADHLDEALADLTGRFPDLRTIRDSDSYREWGEPLADDDPEHLVIEIPAQFAEYTYQALASAHVPVDATLAEDWSSRITWGTGPEPTGWFTRYGRSPATAKGA